MDQFKRFVMEECKANVNDTDFRLFIQATPQINVSSNTITRTTLHDIFEEQFNRAVRDFARNRKNAELDRRDIAAFEMGLQKGMSPIGVTGSRSPPNVSVENATSSVTNVNYSGFSQRIDRDKQVTPSFVNHDSSQMQQKTLFKKEPALRPMDTLNDRADGI